MNIRMKKRFLSIVTAVIIAAMMLTFLPAGSVLAGTADYELVPESGVNTSNYYAFAGSLSANGGSQNYNGALLTKALKMDSKGSIKFTTNTDGAVLIIGLNANKASSSLALNGDTSLISGISTEFTVKTVTLGTAGAYELVKGTNENYVYYVIVSEDGTAVIPDPGEGQEPENPDPVDPEPEVPTPENPDPVVPQPGSGYEGSITGLRDAADSAFQNVVYCAPNLSKSGDGSYANPMKLEDALALSETQGQISILLKGGTYTHSEQLTISQTNNGASGKYKVLKAAKGETVKLDFSGQSYNMSDTSLNGRGLQMNGSYWYISNINFYGAADNGVMLSGSNNVFESCIFEANRDTGLQISRRSSSVTNFNEWPANNLILNCTSFDNNDPATGENADGFASKLTCGNGNTFDGCIAYNNVDDGWDLYAKSATGPIGAVTIKNCIAFRNGATSAGVFTKNSDGNGFKLGGSGIGTAHIVENSMAFENKKHGFTDNNNPEPVTLMNCSSFKNGAGDSNGANFQMDRTTKGGYYVNLLNAGISGSASDKFIGTITNSIFYNSKKWLFVSAPLSINKDKPGAEVSAPAAAEFVHLSSPSIGTNFHSLWRNTDGTVNTKGFLMVVSGSSYADMGACFGTGGSVKPIQ